MMSNSRTAVVIGPLAAHAVVFDERLAALGYSRSTRKQVQLSAAALSEWLREIGVPAAKLTDALVARFCADCVTRNVACPRSGITRLVAMLRTAGVMSANSATHAATRRELLVDGFVDYLREERGLSPLSVEAYRCDVLRFLQRAERDDLRGLRPAEISKAVVREVLNHSPSSVRRFGVALRAFLRYCFVAGILDVDLSASALPVSGRLAPAAEGADGQRSRSDAALVRPSPSRGAARLRSDAVDDATGPARWRGCDAHAG